VEEKIGSMLIDGKLDKMMEEEELNLRKFMEKGKNYWTTRKPSGDRKA
jgi:hypothetical protein